MSDQQEEKFGELKTTPFSEPSWYDPRNESVYYTVHHKKWRATMRQFVETEIMPFRDDWDAAGKIPEELYRKAGKVGLLSAVLGWPEDSPVPRPEGYDGFFTMIAVDELCRCGSGGIVWGLIGGFGIGLPPLHYAGEQPFMKEIVKKCLLGEKRICLAISEAQAGSDVAGLLTSATEDGDDYIITGNKKWITGGMHADYATVAVRTGGAGMMGISLILVDTKSPGFNLREMNCMGAKGSGTAFIELDSVRVPKINVIGDVTVLLRNFVAERMGIAIQANRFARVCLTESIQYVRRRKAFGKLLQEQPVVRAKLANMTRMVETTHAFLESLVGRLVQTEKRGENFFDVILRMGSEAALAKVQATTTFEFCAREAAQIFGGNSYVTGNRIEHLYRQVISLSIPGGAIDVLNDASMRLALQGKL